MKSSNKRIIYTLAVCLIVVFSTSFAVLMTLERMDYRNYLQGEYSKSMYELVNSVENIRANLSKAAVTGSREGSMITFEEIFRYSAMAGDKINSLPIPQETTAETTKFLSQVGDFCYMQAKAESEGRSLSNAEYSKVDTLKNQSLKLQNRLNALLQDINAGKVKWGEIRKKSSIAFAKVDTSTVKDQFKTIQKQIIEYPALIYDGPFSDNVMEIKPKVQEEKVVSKKDADNVLKKALPSYVNKVFKENNNKNKYGLKVFSYTLQDKKNNLDINIDITQNGGKVAYLLNNRKVGKTKLQADEASQKAASYLNSLGYTNMKATYTQQYDNSIVISMVNNTDNILIYPDQIKVKVALDNGEVIGIEAQKYLFSHTGRSLSAPSISVNDARSKVSPRLQVQAAKLAIIPTVSNQEILCYEFTGKYKEDTFLVYIDAKTGTEQRILQIINTPNGELTI